MRKENRDRKDKDRRDRDSGRDRNRDSDRDWNRDRDRNRDRPRDRGHRRDRDSDRPPGTSQDAPVHGPVVLLKRPDGAPSSSSSASTVSANKESREGRGERDTPQSQGKPTAILLRTGQWKKDSFPDLRGASASSSGSNQPSEPSSEVKLAKAKSVSQSSALKPPYKFPHEHAIPLLNANKDMTMESTLDFIKANADLTDFFVVTAIGVPQSGKSTVLSYLGSSNGFGETVLFAPRKLHQQKECSVYMTSSKVVLIEMASVFNGSAASDMITLMGPQGTLETAAMSWNLRIVSWALSVSHVVLLVSEQLIDPNLLQLINSASIIHPTESVFGDGAYTELVYVCNKASQSVLECNNASQVKTAQSVFNSSLGRTNRISQNFYILPHSRWNSQHKEFKNFRYRIDDFVRYNRATYSSELKNIKRFPQTVTLGDWHQSASKVWDDFSQHLGFHAYMKLLP